MSSQIEIVSIISPKPGKIDEVIEALKPLNEWVEGNESGVLRYQLYRQTNSANGVEQLVYIEVFANQKALDEHRLSETYKTLMKQAAELQLLSAPPDVKVLEQVGGFGLRA